MRNDTQIKLHLDLIDTLKRSVELIGQLLREHGRKCDCDLCKLDMPALLYNTSTGLDMLECQLPHMTLEELQAVLGNPTKKAG